MSKVLAVPDRPGAPQKSEQEYQAIKLDPTPRGALGVLGLGGLSLGALAVFTRDVEAGPVALIAVGAFFFLIAIVGYMPTRVKIGDTEAEWKARRAEKALAGFVESSLEEASPELKVELIREAEDLLTRFPELNQSGLKSVLHEERVGEALRRISEESNGAYAVQRRTSVRDDVDFVVTGANGRKVAILATASRSLGLNRRYQEAAHRAVVNDPDVVSALLVVDTDPSAKARERLDASPELKVVVLRDIDDNFELMQSLLKLLDPG